MKTYKYLVIIATVLFVTAVGCKKDDQTQTTNKFNSDIKAFLKQANIFTPNLEPKQKKQAIQKLIEFKDVIRKNSISKNTEDFNNESVAMTRWLLETTLNNEFANLYDSSLNEFNRDTLHYQFQITGINTFGEPMLGGTDIASTYVSLVNKVLTINQNPDSTFYLSMIQLESYDNNSTSFQVVLSIAKKTANPSSLLKSNPHCPWVLSPGQTPVPFGPNESYPPIPISGNPTWAGREIDKKLNANKSYTSYSRDYIIENVWPLAWGSYTDYTWGNDTYWYSEIDLTYLNSTQLNLYLINYKGVLDWYNTPYGYNNIYGSQIITDYINTFQMWPYPESIEGFGPYDAHYFHYVMLPRIKFIYVGPGN